MTFKTANYPFSKVLEDAIVTDLTQKDQLTQAYRFMIHHADEHPVIAEIGTVNILTFMWQYELSQNTKAYILSHALSNIALENPNPIAIYGIDLHHPMEIRLSDDCEVVYKKRCGRYIPHVGELATKSLQEIDQQLRNAYDDVAQIYTKHYPNFIDFAKQLLTDALPHLTHRFIDLMTEHNKERGDMTVFDFINTVLSQKQTGAVFMVPYRGDHIDFVMVIETSTHLEYVIRQELIPYMESRTYRTFFILKPDALEKGIAFDVLKEAEHQGLHVAKLIRTRALPSILRQHYRHIADKSYYQDIEQYMTRGDIYIGILEGYDVVNKWRQLLGNTNPEKAASHTIRARYGNATTFENVAHGSDSRKSAEDEIALWFYLKD